MKRHLLKTTRVETIIDELEHARQRVMSRAYEIFRGRGERLGSALEDWFAAERQAIWRPPIEVCRTDHDVLVEIAVAGVKPDALDIRVTPESLLVQAEVDHSHTAKPGQVMQCEFQPGRLFRAITWPAPVDPDAVTAEYRDGMLYVRAAIAAAARARKVEIHAA